MIFLESVRWMILKSLFGLKNEFLHGYGGNVSTSTENFWGAMSFELVRFLVGDREMEKSFRIGTSQSL